MPAGTVVRGIRASGESYWARTAKIEAENADGDDSSFFVKVHQGEHGRTMISAEFEAMQAIYKAAPEMVARPVACGTYEGMRDTHFFLCEYHEMGSDKPDGAEFAALIASSHKRNVSPDGKFGFPFTTFGGRKPQTFPVSESWEECYAQGTQSIFGTELETHGPDEEWEFLTEATIEQVIPRLLGDLRDPAAGHILHVMLVWVEFYNRYWQKAYGRHQMGIVPHAELTGDTHGEYVSKAYVTPGVPAHSGQLPSSTKRWAIRRMTRFTTICLALHDVGTYIVAR